jgi:hypothetical protein
VAAFEADRARVGWRPTVSGPAGCGPGGGVGRGGSISQGGGARARRQRAMSVEEAVQA